MIVPTKAGLLHTAASDWTLSSDRRELERGWQGRYVATKKNDLSAPLGHVALFNSRLTVTGSRRGIKEKGVAAKPRRRKSVVVVFGYKPAIATPAPAPSGIMKKENRCVARRPRSAREWLGEKGRGTAVTRYALAAPAAHTFAINTRLFVFMILRGPSIAGCTELDPKLHHARQTSAGVPDLCLNLHSVGALYKVVAESTPRPSWLSKLRCLLSCSRRDSKFHIACGSGWVSARQARLCTTRR